MFRALYTAASGMLAQQLNLDTIANNLANASTVGFRETRLQFQDLVYQEIVVPGSAATQQTTVSGGVANRLGHPRLLFGSFAASRGVQQYRELSRFRDSGGGFLSSQADERRDCLHAFRKLPAGPVGKHRDREWQPFGTGHRHRPPQLPTSAWVQTEP